MWMYKLGTLLFFLGSTSSLDSKERSTNQNANTSLQRKIFIKQQIVLNKLNLKHKEIIQHPAYH